MINPVIKEHITFDRIGDPAVRSYIIKLYEQVNGQTKESVLMTIPNPKTVNPVKATDSFTKNESGRYELSKKNIIHEIVYPIKVMINGRRLSPALVFFNSTTGYVSIDYNDLESWDSIEIEFYFDGIQFEHTATNSSTYGIELDIDYSQNTIGDHNVLI